MKDDSNDRHEARTCFDKPLVVTAGAGTGKTTTLVARVLTWCIGPGWERLTIPDVDRPRRILSGVVAITFTDAAAAEMEERITDGLGRLALGASVYAIPAEGILDDSAEQRRRASALLAEIDALAVSTIHAFCTRVLRSDPFEAGLHPAFDVDAEGRELGRLVRAVVESHFVAACLPSSDLQDDLLTLGDYGIGPSQLVDAVEKLVEGACPPDALLEDPFDAEGRAKVVADLRECCAALLNVIVPLFSEPKPKAAKSRETIAGLATIRDAAAALGPNGLSDFVEFLEDCRSALPKKLRERLREWAEGEFLASESSLLSPHGTAIRSAAEACWQAVAPIEAMDPVLFGAAKRVLAPMLREVAERRTQAGVLVFGDLLSGAAALLEANSEVRRRTTEGIDLLLVDEFQDTNPVQCSLVRSLALSGPRDRRPSLFIVGDPKQAIYGWRGADLAAYDGFVGEVKAAGGVELFLAANRRSRTVILDEVKRVVEPIMQREEGLQPAFKDLVPMRQDAGDSYAGPGQAVEYWVSTIWDPAAGAVAAKTKAAESYLLEAEHLAADLVRLSREGQDLGRVGVLMRTGGSLDIYLQAFRRYGVPFLVERDKNYFRRREVADAVALIGTIIEPGDQVALLGFLRSPWVGLPDPALVPLWRGGLPGKILGLSGDDDEALLSVLREDLRTCAEGLARRSDIPGLARLGAWEESVIQGLEQLSYLRGALGRLAPDQFVSRLRSALDIDLVSAARFQGNYRLANLDRLFDGLVLALAEADGDVHAVLRDLRKSVVDQSDAEEARPEDGLEGAVRVMTMHKSKGLDFDHVYIPQIDKRPQPPPRSIGERCDAVQFEGTWQLELMGSSSPGWFAVESARAAVGQRERIRLLYVAMTRARDRLVLMGNLAPAPPKTKKATPNLKEPLKASNMLDLVKHRAPTLDVSPDAMSRVAEASAWTDLSDAVWIRYLGLDSRVVEPLAPSTRWVAPSLEQIRSEQVQLEALREAAAQRQARPLAGAVSAEAHRLGRLERDSSNEEPQFRTPTRGREVGRDIAAAVGTLVHAALEFVDLSGSDPVAAGADAWMRASTVEPGRVDDAAKSRALVLAKKLFDDVWVGPLGARLRELGTSVLARELDFLAGPELLAPHPDRASDRAFLSAGSHATAGEGPIAVLTGSIDLVYQDPATGQLVVADFKTDQVEDRAAREAKLATYSGQLLAYSMAVGRAFNLEYLPRAELWFLRTGHIEVAPVAT